MGLQNILLKNGSPNINIIDQRDGITLGPDTDLE